MRPRSRPRPRPGVGSKRSMASSAAIEPMGEPAVAGLARTIEPEVDPAGLKVILIGDRDLYQRLTQSDPDFARLFKVQASSTMRWCAAKRPTATTRLIASVVASHRLKPIECRRRDRLMEEAARLAEDRDRLLLDGRAVDIARGRSRLPAKPSTTASARDDIRTGDRGASLTGGTTIATAQQDSVTRHRPRRHRRRQDRPDQRGCRCGRGGCPASPMAIAEPHHGARTCGART